MMRKSSSATAQISKSPLRKSDSLCPAKRVVKRYAGQSRGRQVSIGSDIAH
jgi:hypothetical protein